MFFRGKNIDPIRFWQDYCEIKPDDKGPFLDLCFCPNPEHPNSRSPAFQINIERPTVHCFSYCGISGSYEHAVSLIEGLYDKYGYDPEIGDDVENAKGAEREKVLQNKFRKKKAYREARKIIYRKALSLGATGNKPRTKSTLGKAAKRIKEAPKVKEVDLGNYSYLTKDARAYLKNRGINSDSRANWEIGFDEKSKRLTIPVRDQRNRLKFVIRRGIYQWQRPAYLYSDESLKSTCLFGICTLDEAMVRSEGLIVVEGSLDTILQHQDGFRNTVGVLGAYVSERQRELIARLRPKRIILFFDNDAAGVRAVDRAARDLAMYPLFAAIYPRRSFGKDPASLIYSEREAAIRKAVPVLRVKQKLRKAKARV
jgi:DNA primase